MKMKKKVWLIVLLPLMILIGASKEPDKRQETNLKPDGDELLGTWELVKQRKNDDSLYWDIPKFVIYRKLITDKHFTWVHYDANGEEVMGTGGGTYTLKKGTYIENIEYIYPEGGIGLLGSAIPFDCKIIDGKWHHIGYLQHREYDEEKDRYVVVKTEKIEEIWQKIR